MSQFRHPLAVARGLGTAKSGAGHWWWQRLTALLLIPLSLWFVASLVAMTDMSRDSFVLWLQSPVTSTILVLMLVFTYWHSGLGMQVVIEDYISSKWQRVACLIMMKFLLLVTGMSAVLAVLRLCFTD